MTAPFVHHTTLSVRAIDASDEPGPRRSSAARATRIRFLVAAGLVGALATATTLTSGAEAAGTSVSPAPCPRDRIILIGHRGTGPGTRTFGGRRYSENTVPAFVQALDWGVDGFETDYRPTKDGRVVSHHDRTLTRMTDGSGAVSARPWGYVSRLRTPSGAGVPPFLDIQRDTEPYGGLRQQELKDGRRITRAMLRSLVSADRTHIADVRARVLFTSFEIGILRRVHALAPDLAVGLIFQDHQRPRVQRLPGWLDAVMLDYHAGDEAYIRRARAAGLQISLRNVDSVAQLHHAVAIGAARAVTNRPELLGRAC